MKLKELEIVGGSVYLNIVNTETTETMTLPTEKAVEQYGEYEVMEHIPYEGEVTEEESNAKRGRKKPKAGTDIIIIKGEE